MVISNMLRLRLGRILDKIKWRSDLVMSKFLDQAMKASSQNSGLFLYVVL